MPERGELMENMDLNVTNIKDIDNYDFLHNANSAINIANPNASVI